VRTFRSEDIIRRILHENDLVAFVVDTPLVARIEREERVLDLARHPMGHDHDREEGRRGHDVLEASRAPGTAATETSGEGPQALIDSRTSRRALG